MYKDEMINLHQLFEFIMKFMVSNGVSKDSFKRYSDTGMSANHIYKTKEDHEYALMMLSSELSSVLGEMYEDIPKNVPKRFEGFAKKAKKRQKAR